MSKSRIGIGAVGAIVLAAVLALASFAVVRTVEAARATTNKIELDADATTGGIQTVIFVGIGNSFTFVPTITDATESYQSYQSNVSFNPAIISYVSGPVESGGAGLGGASLCAPGTVGASNVFGGCARVSGVQNNTGATEEWTFQCDAPGSSLLHLQTDADVGEATGTNFGNINNEGQTGEPVTVDATVNCVLGVTKTDDLGGASADAGQNVTYTITVNNPLGMAGDSIPGVIADTLPPEVTYVSDDAGCNTGSLPLITCITNFVNPSTSIHITVMVNGDAAGALNVCNTATTYDFMANQTGSVAIDCFNVKSGQVSQVKSTNCDTAPLSTDTELVNLWLGQGPITLCEWALGAGGDPQGVGAFEFQVKYDNHIFDIAVEGTSWLYDTGRVADESNSQDPAVGCAVTIISENDVRFGCVSKNPQPLDPMNGSCLGPDNVTPVDGAVCGNGEDGVIATITVTPKADLIKRITPGNNNGVISSLLDEGCELADIWGHPLSAATGDPNNGGTGYDAFGRELPLPGILPGGQTAICSDVTFTVRILEGDVNTDCVVDVQDDQLEAGHYGATFGSLLYDPWYDLEPALKDYDVDIKDLQKVFGRNGSTCDNPVPPQPPLPQPGDP